MSFDIKFLISSLPGKALRTFVDIARLARQAFSNLSLVNLISKVANLVFYLSAYTSWFTLETSKYDVMIDFCVNSASLVVSLKSAVSSWPETWYQKSRAWYSFYQLTKLIHSYYLETSEYDVMIDFMSIQRHWWCHLKSAMSSWPDKGTFREIYNVYQATCNAAVNMKGNW